MNLGWCALHRQREKAASLRFKILSVSGIKVALSLVNGQTHLGVTGPAWKQLMCSPWPIKIIGQSITMAAGLLFRRKAGVPSTPSKMECSCLQIFTFSLIIIKYQSTRMWVDCNARDFQASKTNDQSQDGYKIVCFVHDWMGIAGSSVNQRFIDDPRRPVDQLLRWHFRQSVLANMRGAGEPIFECDFPKGSDLMSEIVSGPLPAERMEFELFGRLATSTDILD